MPGSISWQAATRTRLAKQRLTSPAKPAQLAKVASELCCVQAQVLSAAELTLGARVRGLTLTKLRSLIWDERALVKTYGPRGTLHLVPADELRFWMAAMRGRDQQPDAIHGTGEGFTSAQAHAVVDAIGAALDGRALTREELSAEVGSKLGRWARQGLASSWGVLLGPAAYAGLLCFGPSQGAKVTFVRADQWVKSWKYVDEEKALREVALRYVATYGPVRPVDFARWFWVSKETAERLFTANKSKLSQVEFDGNAGYYVGKDFKASRAKSSLWLLPQYDTYTLGCVPRDKLIASEAERKRILGYGRGIFESAVGLPVLLIDGQVAGIWERKQTKKKLSIKVEALTKLSADQISQVESEAQRTSDFLELPYELAFTKLT
jgi:hypothetical protein